MFGRHSPASCPVWQGNVGLIFTKGDLKEVSEEVAKYKVSLLFPSHANVMFIY